MSHTLFFFVLSLDDFFLFLSMISQTKMLSSHAYYYSSSSPRSLTRISCRSCCLGAVSLMKLHKLLVFEFSATFPALKLLHHAAAAFQINAAEAAVSWNYVSHDRAKLLLLLLLLAVGRGDHVPSQHGGGQNISGNPPKR